MMNNEPLLVPSYTQQGLDDVYSVTDISLALKKLIDGSMGKVKIRGEISNCKIAASGHVYFSLKDESSLINAICWRSVASKNKFEDGMEVLCTGTVTTYPERSVYQIIVSKIEIAGKGALLALFHQRKEKFALEGLFGNSRKLPFIPRRIGVITSRTGAVIQDIMHRVSERFPVTIMLWSVAVQGDMCPESVAEAIDGFCKNDYFYFEREDGSIGKTHDRPDLLIVARGGGSMEELWGFNDERVVRAAYNSNIPVISAVGHETDYTLLDFAADLRAPTPSAAAEMAVPVRSDLDERVNVMKKRMDTAIDGILNRSDHKVSIFVKSLEKSAQSLVIKSGVIEGKLNRIRILSMMRLNRASIALEEYSSKVSADAFCKLNMFNGQKLDMRYSMLEQIFSTFFSQKVKELLMKGRLMASFGHQNVLGRGFAMVTNCAGDVIMSAGDQSMRKGERINIHFADGGVEAAITSIDNEG